MGFGDWFRIELGIAKALAAIVLILPQIPLRVKEWAYAGLGITFISAAILHIHLNDPTPNIVMPIFLFVVLVVSNICLHKIKNYRLSDI